MGSALPFYAFFTKIRRMGLEAVQLQIQFVLVYLHLSSHKSGSGQHVDQHGSCAMADSTKNSVLPVLPFFAVLLLDLYLYMDVFKSITWRQTSKPASARETQRSNDAGDASVAVDMLNSASPTAWDKWEVEEDGDTLVTWKF